MRTNHKSKIINQQSSIYEVPIYKRAREAMHVNAKFLF